MIVEVLRAVGLIPHRFDFTAADVYEILKRGAVAQGYAGRLVFWYSGDAEKITHVEMMVDNFHTVGASRVYQMYHFRVHFSTFIP